MRKKRLHWDTDGVLAEFNFDISPEKGNMHLLKEGHYYRERPPQKAMVGAVHHIFIYRQEDYEQFNDSAVLPDAVHAWQDKHDWDDEWIPEIDKSHRIFTLCGEDKTEFIPGYDPHTDILIDDYGQNCTNIASKGGTYIKVSVDASDAEYERTKHKYVIHPEMTVEEIVAVIDRASADMDMAYAASIREFDIEYSETYSELYKGIKAYSYEEAVDMLDEMIRCGAVEGPRYCTSSEYIDRTGEKEV